MIRQISLIVLATLMILLLGCNKSPDGKSEGTGKKKPANSDTQTSPEKVGITFSQAMKAEK
jgi:hypothetical protein